ncbi:MAG: type II toxin-antitoxin system Phd/YefM family antitoxin [Anaerolineaceae bacterium]|nr:type II toxin-antitoxin system Phd/YefM family antitoxin [Anaerolineaceae bacterium]
MTSRYNIHHAKTHLSKLLERVMNGEEIIIAKSGKPVARLIPYEQQLSYRTPGRAEGKIKIAADFDDPLPEFEEL